MNKVIEIGRMTKDPEPYYTQGEEPVCISKFSLAVNRGSNNDKADFFNCVAFGKTAEFINKYFKKGMKIALEGHLQSGSYNDKNGNKVYTTDIVVEQCEFCEKKVDGEASGSSHENSNVTDGFMNIPDGIDEELPFN